MSVLIGIDIGGTFTDIVALNEDTGELKVTKVPSTPGEFSKGFSMDWIKFWRFAGESRRK